MRLSVFGFASYNIRSPLLPVSFIPWTFWHSRVSECYMMSFMGIYRCQSPQSIDFMRPRKVVCFVVIFLGSSIAISRCSNDLRNVYEEALTAKNVFIVNPNVRHLIPYPDFFVRTGCNPITLITVESVLRVP
jgi:hypothetical protein